MQYVFGILDGALLTFIIIIINTYSCCVGGHLPHQLVCKGVCIHHGIPSSQEICEVDTVINSILC